MLGRFPSIINAIFVFCVVTLVQQLFEVSEKPFAGVPHPNIFFFFRNWTISMCFIFKMRKNSFVLVDNSNIVPSPIAGISVRGLTPGCPWQYTKS